jgi:hypothetical protein
MRWRLPTATALVVAVVLAVVGALCGLAIHGLSAWLLYWRGDRCPVT